MSRFFEELEFEEPKDVGVQLPKQLVIWDKEKLAEAHKQILAEIAKIKNGTSPYVSYAIDPGRFGFPAQNAIQIFISNPSDKSFRGIRDICKQDFKATAGELFYNLLKDCRRVEPNPEVSDDE